MKTIHPFAESGCEEMSTGFEGGGGNKILIIKWIDYWAAKLTQKDNGRDSYRNEDNNVRGSNKDFRSIFPEAYTIHDTHRLLIPVRNW